MVRSVKLAKMHIVVDIKFEPTYLEPHVKLVMMHIAVDIKSKKLVGLRIIDERIGIP